MLQLLLKNNTDALIIRPNRYEFGMANFPTVGFNTNSRRGDIREIGYIREIDYFRKIGYISEIGYIRQID